MAKRKKRILFDVMGTGESPRKVPVGKQRTARSAPPPATPEVRLSYSLAGTFGVVFLVVVALAYYLGHRQGSQTDDDLSALRRDRGTSRAATGKGPFSIRARRVPFTPHLRDQAVRELKAQRKLLIDQGFQDVQLRVYTKGHAKGEGLLQLWVERARSSEDLKPLIDKVRTLRDDKGRMPFGNAYIRKLPGAK